jgi:glyoxylase-like metal-dependent hydrolase (beta-lactamase superfamily II)
MIIESLDLPPIGTNAYGLINPDEHSACVIDAPAGAFDWAHTIAQQYECRIEALVLTHGHWDHILDAHKFAEIDCPIYGHQADEILFNEPEKMANFALPSIQLHPCTISQWLTPGTDIELIGQQFEVRHVPGHCAGNILLYSPKEKCAFVGDVIFEGSIGRYDLPGGDFAVLEQSIKEQVYTLPPETTLYTGHGGPTTVKKEASSNPFVRA